MPDGYGIGISRQPIDFVSGAMAFGQAAADERLKEIEQNREIVSENYKNILKASSIKSLPELTNKLRDKYQVEIEDYRNEIMEMFKSSGGKLSAPQQRDIQDGFVDMQQNMLSDVGMIKRVDEAAKRQFQPGFTDAYNTDAYMSEVGQIRSELDAGKDVGNVNARLAQHLKRASVGDYLHKHYGEHIANLDIQSLGGYTGNVFTQTEFKGINVDTATGIRKVQDFVKQAMQDPEFVNRYTDANGVVNEEAKTKVKQQIEDAISPIVQKVQKGFTPRRTAGEDVFISYEPDTETTGTGGDKVTFDVKANIPLEGTGIITFGGEKMWGESIKWVNVANDKSVYDKKTGGVSEDEAAYAKSIGLKGEKVKSPRSKALIIDNDVLGSFNSDEYKTVPMVKMIVPTGYGEETEGLLNRFSLSDWLNAGKKTKVKWMPLEGGVKAQLYSEMKKKRPFYEEKISEANKRFLGKEDVKYTRKQEAVIKKIMKQSGATREEAIEAINTELNK